jgi:hypothetical protein
MLVNNTDYTQTENGTHYLFHIEYNHSTHTIEITGTEVIPEFGSVAMVLPLLTVGGVLAAFLSRKRICSRYV